MLDDLHGPEVRGTISLLDAQFGIIKKARGFSINQQKQPPSASLYLQLSTVRLSIAAGVVNTAAV